jgi:hypothetical protein
VAGKCLLRYHVLCWGKVAIVIPRSAWCRRSTPAFGAKTPLSIFTVNQRLTPTQRNRQGIESLICPYCKDHFQFFSSIVRCKECRTSYHDICWYTNKVCSTFGCNCTETVEYRAERRNDLGIGLIILAFFIMGILFMFKFPDGRDDPPGSLGGFVTGINFFYWGSLFAMSYLYEDRSFVFRGLMWLSQNVAWTKRSRSYVFLYSAWLFIVGLLTILT